MARVVQQRGTPPYLLIVFVFLFLVSAALAVIFYTGQGDENKKVTKLESDNKKLVQENQGLLNTVIPSLVEKITGAQGPSADAARADADRSLSLKHSSEHASRGLSKTVVALNDTIVDRDKKIEDLERQKKELDDAIREKNKAIAKITADFEGNAAKTRGELTNAAGNMNTLTVAHQQQLERTGAEKDAIVKEKEQKITALAQELEAKGKDMQRLQARIDELVLDVRRGRGTGAKPGELIPRQPDGKIARTVDQNTVYINLGAGDHVIPGLPFTVYSSATGVTEDGKGKAKLVVVNVGPTTSECRVTELAARENPIIEGDVIANVVFNPNRSYNFVVEGDFDLYGAGKPDPQAAGRLRSMIESFGGMVQDVVTVNTDFVVMGEDPPLPPKPADDAPPEAMKIAADKRKRFDAYQAVKATATALQIPILNTNRFMALTGFMPKKRLTQ